MDIKSIIGKIRNDDDVSEVRHSGLKDILTGKFLLKDFIRRQYGLLLLLAVLAFVYIDNHYHSERQQARMVQLQKELKDAKYESLTISAQLMQMGRESNVLRMLEERGIDLTESRDLAIKIDE